MSNFLRSKLKQKARQLGTVSFICGVLAIAFATTAKYARSVFDRTDWSFLRWLEDFGIMRTNPDRVADVSSFSILAVNEWNSILWCYWLALMLAGLSLIASVGAEMGEVEDNALLSAGAICSAMSVIAIDWKWGFATLILSAVLILGVRYSQKQSRSSEE